MVTKPLFIPPTVKSQDYSEIVRKSARSFSNGGESFAQAMDEQQEERQSSGNSRAVTQSETRTGRPPAISTATGSFVTPIALDQRSLSTLQRLADGRERGRALPVRRTATNAAPKSEAASAKPVDTKASPSAEKTNGEESLGTLSAQFESGNRGIAAVGYDRNGGTSYGKYQISSRQGTFDAFLKFAQAEAPDIAAKLRKAGKANTGSTRGAMPDAWRAVAKADPERFEQLQEAFIRQSHYDPVEAEVKKQLGVDELSRPVQEVVWSTAVQHGPGGAKRLFDRATTRLSQNGKDLGDEKALIEAVYNLRRNQFSSSTPAVQAAVRQRFDIEKEMALAMVQEQPTLV